MSRLKYLGGYPPDLLARVEQLIAQGQLAESLAKRYPDAHAVRTDRALYDYVGERDISFVWAEKKGPQGLVDYVQEKNLVSLDGLPTELGRK